MDKARQAEVALLYFKHKARRDGLRLNPNFKRDVGNTAKEIGISTEEAMEFVEIMTRELVEEIFVKKAPDVDAKSSHERV